MHTQAPRPAAFGCSRPRVTPPGTPPPLSTVAGPDHGARCQRDDGARRRYAEAAGAHSRHRGGAAGQLSRRLAACPRVPPAALLPAGCGILWTSPPPRLRLPRNLSSAPHGFMFLRMMTRIAAATHAPPHAPPSHMCSTLHPTHPRAISRGTVASSFMQRISLCALLSPLPFDVIQHCQRKGKHVTASHQ